MSTDSAMPRESEEPDDEARRRAALDAADADPTADPAPLSAPDVTMGALPLEDDLLTSPQPTVEHPTTGPAAAPTAATAPTGPAYRHLAPPGPGGQTHAGEQARASAQPTQEIPALAGWAQQGDHSATGSGSQTAGGQSPAYSAPAYPSQGTGGQPPTYGQGGDGGYGGPGQQPIYSQGGYGVYGGGQPPGYGTPPPGIPGPAGPGGSGPQGPGGGPRKTRLPVILGSAVAGVLVLVLLGWGITKALSGGDQPKSPVAGATAATSSSRTSSSNLPSTSRATSSPSAPTTSRTTAPPSGSSSSAASSTQGALPPLTTSVTPVGQPPTVLPANPSTLRVEVLASGQTSADITVSSSSSGQDQDFPGQKLPFAATVPIPKDLDEVDLNASADDDTVDVVCRVYADDVLVQSDQGKGGCLVIIFWSDVHPG